MIEMSAIMLQREDLRSDVQNISVHEMEWEMFKQLSMETYAKANVVMFVDDSGLTKIMKNRYGNMGFVVPDR